MAYRKQMIELTRLLFKPGALYITTVQHDDWCAFWGGGECDCDPDFIVREYERDADSE